MNSSDGQPAPSLGRVLARRLEHVRDHQQRVVLLREFCDTQGADAVVDALQGLLQATQGGRHRAAWLAVAVTLAAGEIPYDVVGDLYRAAVEADLGILRLILLATDKPLRVARDGDFARDDTVDSLTLGQRKSTARTLDRQMLERLMLYDGDPAVIRIALANPRTTEREVLRLASRRPNRSRILRELLHQPRWIVRPAVQRALIYNPYTPVRIVLTLLPLLSGPQLQELMREPNAHPHVSSACRQLLHLRGWSPPTIH